MCKRWTLGVVLLSLGCASVPPVRGRGRELHQGSRVSAGPRWQGRSGGGETAPPLEFRAVRDAIQEVKDSLDGIARGISRLEDRDAGIGGHGGVFMRYLEHGSGQVAGIRGLLNDATLLQEASEAVTDAELAQGLLRMSGQRIEAALASAMLLAAWLDFLQLADAVLEQCPFFSVEQLFVDLARVQGRIDPSLKRLQSLEPEQVESASVSMPGQMGALTREFQSIREGVRASAELGGKVVAAARLLEMVTLVSSLKASLPRPPPAAPVSVGVGLVMGSGGVMMGSRIVVSAEWVERMRALVQAGILSAPVVNAAVRVHAGQVLMAQGGQDLPKGVREALGEGPEVRGMRETGRAGAGMSAAPRHHVMPREHREWFEKRGFKGAMDIDNFCVRLERSHHEAIHGGGDWRMGRTWAGEWNQMVMKALRDAEVEAGTRLTRNEVLAIVAVRMKLYDIPMNFVRGSRR
ncbi:DUF2380 domain-containing protein [Corallococcus exiguus]|uniref:DUF2380 domain-containing protein n=1 Tax=Corallococcus TaxID=83461 RepID=UPI000EC5100E|nr:MULTISPECIES: DUF2380 domain-containing protein [Corallococcus]NPC69744.1 DUF2380 domain-containing protein [Corallococcus exiguus]RKH96547.1 DUF2380 domain-containing protein [Corallococcus sp. AB038B]